MGRNGSICVELVQGGADALEPWRDRWRDLWRADPTATPFQHPAWLTAWWRHLGVGDLRILMLWSGNDLAGILPLFREEVGAGARWVLLGAGTSDYLGGVFEPGRAPELVEAAVGWLAARLPPDEPCHWHQLRADSPLLQAHVPPALTRDSGESVSCPALPLPSTDEAFEATSRKGFAAKLRQAWRRGSREAPLTLERARPESAREHFDTLAALHGATWEERGSAGVLCHPGVRAAHRECLPELVQEGVAVLLQLRKGTTTLAAYYGLMDPPRAGRRAYSYLGGFDPGHAVLSPGSLVLRQAIASSIREGCVRFDFLRGEERYKERWGARPEPTFAVTLQRIAT